MLTTMIETNYSSSASVVRQRQATIGTHQTTHHPSQTNAESVKNNTRINGNKSLQANLFAQKLNNSAVLCIEIGEYKRAILSLGKALKLLELYSSLDDACMCSNCSLDECISYSEMVVNSVSPENKTNGLVKNTSTSLCRHKNKKQRLYMSSTPSSAPAPAPAPAPQEQEATNNKCFWTPSEYSGPVYRSPIRVTPRSILEGHNMGSPLFLIITFNLALAHHLSSLSSSTHETTLSLEEQQQQHQLYKSAMKLYELANSWQRRHNCQGSSKEQCAAVSKSCHRSPGSIRFHMILSNNLSQLYRSMNNVAKHQEYLKDLLSSVILLVDQQQQHPFVEPDSNEDYDQDETAATSTSPYLNLIRNHEYCDDDDDEDSSVASNRRRRPSMGRELHLKEYIQNTIQIVLRENCADAA